MTNEKLQSLTNKELNYIVDCIANEDLLLKQCAATSAVINDSSIKQALTQYITSHNEHLDMLIKSLQDHQKLV